MNLRSTAPNYESVASTNGSYDVRSIPPPDTPTSVASVVSLLIGMASTVTFMIESIDNQHSFSHLLCFTPRGLRGGPTLTTDCIQSLLLTSMTPTNITSAWIKRHTAQVGGGGLTITWWPGLVITFSNWTISRQIVLVCRQSLAWAGVMSGQWSCQPMVYQPPPKNVCRTKALHSNFEPNCVKGL